MDRDERMVDPFAGLKEAKDEYHVYDSHYERIGRVDDLLVDEADRVLYVGVKMGLFGSNSTIVPVEAIRVNDKRQLIEIMDTEENVKHAPHFGHRDELTPEFEDRVRTHFGLAPLHAAGPRTDARYGEPDLDRFAPDPRVDTEPGERAFEQRGTSSSLDRSPLDRETADRDIREPAEGGYVGEDTARNREPSRTNLDIPLDDTADREPRREPVVRKKVSGDRWEELDATGGGIKVHRKRT